MGDVIETIIDYGEYATAIARITTLVIRFQYVSNEDTIYLASATNFNANVALIRVAATADEIRRTVHDIEIQQSTA